MSNYAIYINMSYIDISNIHASNILLFKLWASNRMTQLHNIFINVKLILEMTDV